MCMDWREWIKRKGIKNVANECGLSYEMVRLWVKGVNEPTKRHIVRLIEISEGELRLEDFFPELVAMGQ